MSLYKYRFVVVLILVSYSHGLMSQDKNTVGSNSSYVSLSLNYISDAVFMGRKDSISAPYIYPTFLYHHKSGLYASGSLSYLTKANEGRIDVFLLTGGFDFTIKKFDGDISLTTYFFNEDSYNVISEVGADVTAFLEYDFHIINLGISASTYFNSDSSNDFFLTSEISHDFLTNSGEFQFSPTIGIFFGTQNFYEQYFVNNRFGNGRGQSSGQAQGNLDTMQSTSIMLNESDQFNLMAIEFSLPMWYVKKLWTFSFLPTFVLPKNSGTLTVDNVIFEEDLESTLYWIMGIDYRF